MYIYLYRYNYISVIYYYKNAILKNFCAVSIMFGLEGYSKSGGLPVIAVKFI